MNGIEKLVQTGNRYAGYLNYMGMKNKVHSIALLAGTCILLFAPKAFCSAQTSLPVKMGYSADLSGTTQTLPAQAVAVPSETAFFPRLAGAWAAGGKTPDAIGQTVRELNTIKIDNGFMNLYPYSLVLLDTYRSRHDVNLLKEAMELSPSMAEPYFDLSYALLTGAKANYSLAAANISRGITSFFDDPYNILRFSSNRLINLTLSVFIVLFFFSLLLIVRYYVQIYMLLRSVVPEYLPGYAVVVFSVVIILLPFLFGTGFLWLLVLWLAVTFLYQKPAERAVSAGFLIFLGMLTFISLVIVATIIKPAEEPFTGAMNIQYGNASGKDIAALKSYADAHTGDLYSNLYLGVYYKRLGDYPAAAAYYQRLSAAGYGNLPMVLCNIGTLAYATGHTGTAETDYKQVVAADPQFFPARYNLGQLYLIQGNIDGTNELDTAKMLDPALFSYYASVYQKSNLNRTFADALPPPRTLASIMFQDTLHNPTAIGLADVMVSWLIQWPSAKYLPMLALWLLFLFMGLLILAKFVQKYYRCTSCGRVYTPLSRTDAERGSICSDCLRLYVKNEIKDTRKKLEITQRSHRWKRRLRMATIVSSLLIPGSGYILRGRPLRGMVLLASITYLGMEYITSFGLITPVFPVYNPYTGLFKLVTGSLIAVVYVMNVLFAVRGEAKWY